jgi:serine protease Do
MALSPSTNGAEIGGACRVFGRGGMGLGALLFFSLLWLSGCSFFSSGGEGDRGNGMLAPSFQSAIKSAKKQVFPSLVFIIVLKEEFREGKKSTTEAVGSGVIISAKGEVLTNWHVINKALEIRCLLYSGEDFEAELKGKDQDTDLALLQLKLPEGHAPLPYVEIGDSSVLQEGDMVMALGAPWGLSRSISAGIVSCARRYLPGNSEYSLWLQTDASISPGNSGGPLVNLDGAIVGLNSMGSMGGGGDIGFAIPSETIRQLLPQLHNEGKVSWSWSGLCLQPLRNFRQKTYYDVTSGVIVSGTENESPARRAGVMPKDRILRVNGEPLTAVTEEDLPDIKRKLGLLPKGKPMVIELDRDGQILTVEVTPREKGEVEGLELDCPRWDLTVKSINQFDNPELHFQRREGVFIYGVKMPGNALRSGFQRNDIIISVEGQEIRTLGEIKAIHESALANLKAKSRVLCTILRNGRLKQVVLDFSRDFDN